MQHKSQNNVFIVQFQTFTPPLSLFGIKLISKQKRKQVGLKVVVKVRKCNL